MSKSVSFNTKKPLPLSVQIKSFGEHKNVPMGADDAFRIVAAGIENAVIVDDQTGEETPLTMENYQTVEAEDEESSGDEEEPSEEEIVSTQEGEDLVTFISNEVFLNGTAGNIYLREDGVTVLRAYDSVGNIREYPLTPESIIWGGCKEASTKKSEITMKGGTVHTINGGGCGSTTVSADVDEVNIFMSGGTVGNVIGGGTLASRCKNVLVEITGGSVRNVYGGGDSSYNNKNVGTKANPAASKCVVENTTVTILGVTFLKQALIYGGGMDYSYTKNTSVLLDDVNVADGWITAGGANGRTDNASLTINNGNYSIVQSINRGSMKTAKITVNGGNITKLYAGGENASDVTGIYDADGSIELDLNGGVIENLHIGTSGGTTISADSEMLSTVVNGSTVNNLDDARVAFGACLVTK